MHGTVHPYPHTSSQHGASFRTVSLLYLPHLLCSLFLSSSPPLISFILSGLQLQDRISLLLNENMICVTVVRPERVIFNCSIVGHIFCRGYVHYINLVLFFMDVNMLIHRYAV